MTIQERREAYRKAKAEKQAKLESDLEAIRWQVEMRVLAEFPDVEFVWHQPTSGPERLIEVSIKHKGGVLAACFGYKAIERPDTVSFVAAHINEELSKGPIRHLFE